MEITTNADDGYLGLSYASSQPTALVRMFTGSVVVATGDVDLRATTATTLTMRTEVSNDGDVAGISASFGKTQSLARAAVAAGAAVTAHDLTLLADAVRTISHVVIAGGFSKSEKAGVGAVLAVGYYVQAAEAVLAGTVTTTGDVLVETHSHEIANNTQAFGSVTAQPAGQNGTGNGIEKSTNDTVGSLDPKVDADGRTVDPKGGAAQKFTIGAAIALLESENKAASWIDDGAYLSVGGSLKVKSLAEAKPRASAVAAATGTGGGTSGTAIGGAVIWSKLGNQATSFVGYNAVVDVAHVLELDATATVSSPVAALDPTIDLASLGDTYDDAKAAGAKVATALDGVAAYLAPSLADKDKIATSYVHAAVGGGSKTALSGGVNYLEIYSMAATGIAPGARVNQRGLTAGSDQDVVLDARSTFETATVAGLESALVLPTGGVAGAAQKAGGGYASALIADNYARSYIDDRATVKAARDIKLDALTDSKVLNVAKQGATGDGLTIEGVFGIVVLDHETLAFVEDRATVDAGRDIGLTAQDRNLVVNVAGAKALSSDDAIGVAVAVTLMRTPDVMTDRADLDDDGEPVAGSSIRAFIGDAAQEMGSIGTGGIVGKVTAGGAVTVKAVSDPAHNEIWTAAVAGAGPAPAGGGPAKGTNLSKPSDSTGSQPIDVSVAGGAAINVYNVHAIAYVRDIDVVAAGELRVEASAAALVVASAGASLTGANKSVGATFALNVVHPTVQVFAAFTELRSANLSLIATSNVTALSFETTTLDVGMGATGITVAVAVNLVVAGSNVQAWFGDAVTLHPTGDVLVQAISTLDIIASAGTASFSKGSSFAVGAAVTLVFADSTAIANIRLAVDTAGGVAVAANSDLRIRAFAGIDGGTDRRPPPTTAPAGQIVVVVADSFAEADITDAAIVSGAAVSIAATSKLREVAAAIGDASSGAGGKDAAVATSVLDSAAHAKLTGGAAVTAAGALSVKREEHRRRQDDRRRRLRGDRWRLRDRGRHAADRGLHRHDRAGQRRQRARRGRVRRRARDRRQGEHGRRDNRTRRRRTPARRATPRRRTAMSRSPAPWRSRSSTTRRPRTSPAARRSRSRRAASSASRRARSTRRRRPPTPRRRPADPGIGVAVAIALTNVPTRAYAGSVANLTASALVIEAVDDSAATYEVIAKSGASPSTGTVIAGALALHLLTTDTSAVLPAASSVAVAGADVTLSATSKSTSTVKALPAPGSGTGTGTGVGASVAVHVVNDTTTAALEPTAALTGADDLTLTASSADTMTTEAQSGVSAGTAITGAFAISISNVKTDATIGAGSPLVIDGALSATAPAERDRRDDGQGRSGRDGPGCRPRARADARRAPRDGDDRAVR